MSAYDSDFDFEPIEGLPQKLPEGEHLLWQGSPDPHALAMQIFKLRWLAFYFGCLAIWQIASGTSDGLTPKEIVVTLVWTTLLAASSIGILYGLGQLVARGTVYSVTSRRLVIRHGVAMPMAVNVPFSKIDSAAFRPDGSSLGNIPLKLVGDRTRLSYLALWPHAKPGNFTQPQPMLRLVPDGERVAGIVARALAATALQPAVRVRVAQAPPTAAQHIEATNVAVAS